MSGPNKGVWNAKFPNMASNSSMKLSCDLIQVGGAIFDPFCSLSFGVSHPIEDYQISSLSDRHLSLHAPYFHSSPFSSLLKTCVSFSSLHFE